MKFSKKATSIAEAIIITMIISMWVVWVYNIFSNSIKFTTGIENKIQAIQIAKEWIEVIENIRDTNWIIFSSNKENCWKTLNYNATCLTTTANNIADLWSWSYIIYKWTGSKWYLESKTTWDYSDSTYRENFKVWYDSNWLYTQTWIVDEIKPLYTREIIIYTASGWDDDISSYWLEVKSVVRWNDSSSTDIREIVLDSILTNYKKND